MTNKTKDYTFLMSSLDSIKDDYDKLLGIVRKANINNPSITWTWLVLPFLRALFNYKPLLSKDDASSLLTKVMSSSLMINSGIVLSILDIFVVKEISFSNNLFYWIVFLLT
ncbi:hypothetical protein [Bacillus sp. SM2101]|uniref:hypothetical protein n=1 Tax=Bacillus sp. SM2101 TaxID=2805366 RepID=UPI001BDEEA05|nr:hypothetical protein [Bacillus sp. SM2101]